MVLWNVTWGWRHTTGDGRRMVSLFTTIAEPTYPCQVAYEWLEYGAASQWRDTTVQNSNLVWSDDDEYTRKHNHAGTTVCLS